MMAKQNQVGKFSSGLPGEKRFSFSARNAWEGLQPQGNHRKLLEQEKRFWRERRECSEKTGSDRTAQFLAGAQAALAQLKEAGTKRVYLKSKSPSCGVGKIHDGTFTGKLICANGVAAELFLQNGLDVVCINE